MVKRIIGLIGMEINGLHEAAYLLAIFAFSSQILGLIRDRLLASYFGTSAILDVYYASFRIPDLLFVVVSAMVSSAVLIPIFSRNLSQKKVLKEYIDSLFTVFIGAMLLIVFVAFVFTPQFLALTAPGLKTSLFYGDLVLFTRILLLSPVLLGISQLFGGIIQAYRKFILYAISPLLYNLGIIIGVIFFYPLFGSIGLIFGVCLGLIFHVLVQLPAIASYDLVPIFNFHPNLKIIKEIIFLSLPRTLTLASSQITLIFLIALASNMASGSITIFNFAYNLQSVPMSIIGVSYSLAAFPTLSRLFTNGDFEKFLSHLIGAARHIIFWSIPVIVMFIILRAQIVRTVLGAGQFDWSDTRLTAAALALFIISALAQSLVLLFVRGYYSAGKTSKPLFINIFSSLATILLAFFLVNFYEASPSFKNFLEVLLRVEGGLPSLVLMLPLAFSIGVILNVILLWISFEKDFKGFSQNLLKPFLNSSLASLVAGFSTYLSLNIFDDVFNLMTLSGIFFQGFFSGMIGLFLGGAVLFFLKSEELTEVWKTLHRKIWKTRVITVGQEKL